METLIKKIKNFYKKSKIKKRDLPGCFVIGVPSVNTASSPKIYIKI